MNTIRRIHPIFVSILVLFGLLGATFQPAFASAEALATCQQWHTVQRGEYLSSIAKLYNTDWPTLAEINNLKDPSRIYPGQKLCVSMTGTGTVVVPQTGSVRVYAKSVKEDTSVTLVGRYLTASTRYTIYLNRYGADASKAILTGWASTDKFGAFQITYTVPKKLIDVPMLSVSIYSKAGDSASNWFVNATAEGNTGGIGAPSIGINIQSVKKDQTVKIQATNLIANVTYNVYIGKVGSKGVGGVLVGTLMSEKGGSLKATMEIPGKVQGKAQFDIRIESQRLGMYVYQTVSNKTK